MISPQGYKLGEDPKSQNPFWGEGEDSNVNKIYATASVDNGTGVPSVTTSKTVSGSDITFDFAFHNLKGKEGDPGKSGFSPSARVEQTETGATITVTDKSGTTTATVNNGTPGKVGDPGPAGPGVPEGGTAGQVLTKKSGTDYDTEWKDPAGGGASGHISFGGKSGDAYEPRLEEILYKSSMYFSKYIDVSASANYRLDGGPVSDTINISGELNIPSDTPIETTLNYYIGGDEYIKSNVEYATMKLEPTDFTISLSSGNAINIISLNITNIGSSDILSQKNALIEVSFIVSNETSTGRGQETIDIGQLNVRGNSVYNTYYLEPQK